MVWTAKETKRIHKLEKVSSWSTALRSTVHDFPQPSQCPGPLAMHAARAQPPAHALPPPAHTSLRIVHSPFYSAVRGGVQPAAQLRTVRHVTAMGYTFYVCSAHALVRINTQFCKATLIVTNYGLHVLRNQDQGLFVVLLLVLCCGHTGIEYAKICTLSAQTCESCRQAKICTPPGGAMVAKICKL